MRDALPPHPLRNETGVLNLDDSASPGTHWTAWCKKGNFVKYYDSHGNLSPPIAFMHYMKGVKKIEYNTWNDQPHGSMICGHLALRFLSENHCRI